MWAVGTVLHAMLTRELPFPVEQYPYGNEAYMPPSDVSLECQDLLRKLLSRDPQVCTCKLWVRSALYCTPI